MIQTSIFEQITLFFDIVMRQTNKYIILGFSIVIIFLLILANKFKNKKITKCLCFLIYFGIFGYLIFMYHNEILNLLDYFMDNFVRLILFPNLAIYILVLVLVNVFIVRSTFSNYDNFGQKIINILFFVLFNILFYLIVNNIINNQINVYEQLDIYTNRELLNLIVLNMKIFLIWLITIIIIKFINHMINRIELKKQTNHCSNKNLIAVTDQISKRKNIIKKDKKIKSYNKYNDLLDVVPIKKKNLNSSFIFEKEVEEIKPIIEYGISNHKVSEFNILDNQKKTEFDSLNSNEKCDNLVKNNLDKVPTLDELLPFQFNYQSHNLVNLSNCNNYQLKEEINLENYDYIFKEKNILAEDFDYNINKVFSASSLENILSDIDKLQNNQNDKNTIEDIYFKIKMNQKDLSLNDYNCLINRLLQIKK